MFYVTSLLLISQVPVELALEVDESYELNIPQDSHIATLSAQTVWGALHGLETFAQLIDYKQSFNGQSGYVTALL